jgi:hypothetical protein
VTFRWFIQSNRLLINPLAPSILILGAFELIKIFDVTEAKIASFPGKPHHGRAPARANFLSKQLFDPNINFAPPVPPD